MGVCTVTLVSVRHGTDHKIVVADVALSNTYATNGDTLGATQLSLDSLIHMTVPATNLTATRLLAFDQPNAKLKCFTALSTEAGNGTDQSTITVRVKAIGKGGTAAV